MCYLEWLAKECRSNALFDLRERGQQRWTVRVLLFAEEEEAEAAGVVFRCNWLFTLADSF